MGAEEMGDATLMSMEVKRPTDSSLASHTGYIEYVLEYIQGCPAQVPDRKSVDLQKCAICHDLLVPLNRAYDKLLKSIKTVDSEGNLNTPMLKEVEGFEGVLEKIVQDGPAGALGRVEEVLQLNRSSGAYRRLNGYFRQMEKLSDAWRQTQIKECI
jgi:hypothetical protein